MDLSAIDTADDNDLPAPITLTKSFERKVHQNIVSEDGDTKMRNKVINELINTEKDYVDDLDLIINVIMMPLRDNKILSDKDINIIFSNIQVLLGVNQAMLENLVKTAKVNDGISMGPCFNLLADFLKVYSTYCSNHQNSTQHLAACIKKHAHFKQYLEEKQALPECRMIHLESMLIKPIQRLCKYPLLLRELIKNSDKSHPDIPSLNDAYAKIEAVVASINEDKRRADAQQKMFQIHEQLESTEKFELLSPTRYFIREDTIKELTDERDKISGKCTYYLFNDIIMRTKKEKKSIKLETLFVIGCITIVDNEQKTGGTFCNTCELGQIGRDGRKLTLLFDTYEQKMEWMNEIEQLSKPFKEESAREYEKMLDHDVDPTIKRNTIATGNPSSPSDPMAKSLARSATSTAALTTSKSFTIPSKPLPPAPSHTTSKSLSNLSSMLNDAAAKTSSAPTSTSSSPRASLTLTSSSPGRMPPPTTTNDFTTPPASPRRTSGTFKVPLPPVRTMTTPPHISPRTMTPQPTACIQEPPSIQLTNVSPNLPFITKSKPPTAQRKSTPIPISNNSPSQVNQMPPPVVPRKLSQPIPMMMDTSNRPVLLPRPSSRPPSVELAQSPTVSDISLSASVKKQAPPVAPRKSIQSATDYNNNNNNHSNIDQPSLSSSSSRPLPIPVSTNQIKQSTTSQVVVQHHTSPSISTAKPLSNAPPPTMKPVPPPRR
ncbi:hypothetical protein SAMD00019534_066020 [Acytostelium subglobosum LB1]|uniref:hypothetical protein n=1 Tax=Acytostelium subglobosum LB1 TaxID=1410327 RepID=UPI0006451038|nr:hypothetical protein SAMD00019534_066020 [Acytostelium subglobosum LB1]GAM23427.1 hypothetical protein SAMD00019534_066020 [Acytostelium subglobosum LB1]|eukprot:XP_012753876.1 hypothetical protein SAMD00019534_066020 [Acytostelium subglobosum LB1]